MGRRSISEDKTSPRPIARSSRHGSLSASPAAGSGGRAASTARLASPIPSSLGHTPPVRQIPTPAQLGSDGQPALETGGPIPANSPIGPGRSALAAAFEGSLRRSPPRHGTPPIRAASPPSKMRPRENTTYGSFDARTSSPAPAAPASDTQEDPRVIKRYLVQPSSENLRARAGSNASDNERSRARNGQRDTTEPGPDLDEFSSLQLQGGDMTREVYRWAEDAATQSSNGTRARRSKSYQSLRPEPAEEVLDIQNIKVPGGFRRNFLRRSAVSPSPSRASQNGRPASSDAERATGRPPHLFTNNFLEFLTLYGHFAGEDLEDDDDGDAEDAGDYLSAGRLDAGSNDEERPLLTPRTPRTPLERRKSRRAHSGEGQNTPMGAALLLLKSFVGTGVLFLPRAFLNGGMLFSSLVLLGVAGLSYYCFILLVRTRLLVDGSYGDLGGTIYGPWLRWMILGSIVLSQIGFVAAYIVFTSENLQAFVIAVSQCRTWIDIQWMVLMQLIVFLPLSLIRDISKLGFTALVADVFILLGLVYLYYYDVATLIDNRGPADIVSFNPNDWTLFIGTAIFTFEGIGLILPIQESMKKPSEFPKVLALVMVIITAVFTSMGAISYAAFGSATRTVVLLNLPQDNKFVNAVQFLYSLAILLSTPLQLFPAIRILETGLFTRSGKYNSTIKWEKNIFRFLLVMLCAAIAWGGAGDLDKFVAIVGSFACIPLVYVYPPLLHLRVGASSRWERISDIVLFVFGVVGMAYTTALTAINWAGSAKMPKQPEYCDT